MLAAPHFAAGVAGRVLELGVAADGFVAPALGAAAVGVAAPGAPAFGAPAFGTTAFGTTAPVVVPVVPPPPCAPGPVPGVRGPRNPRAKSEVVISWLALVSWLSTRFIKECRSRFVAANPVEISAPVTNTQVRNTSRIRSGTRRARARRDRHQRFTALHRSCAGDPQCCSCAGTRSAVHVRGTRSAVHVRGTRSAAHARGTRSA